MAAGHSPMAQFEVHRLIPLEIGGVDISFTNASLWMALAVAAGCTFLVASVRRDGIIPGRMQSVVELMYDFIERQTVFNVMGESGKKFFPFIFSLFIFIFFTNFLGLIPYSFTVTSHIIVTFAMALSVFVLVLIVGFWTHGLHFFSLFVPSGAPLWIMPLIVPIEIISFLSRPISLSVRLAANMLAGHTMLKVFAGFIVTMLGAGGVLSVLSIAPLLAGVAVTALEVLVAAIQAWVFALLTCIYLNEAVHLHEH
ncbi:MAG: F0F1 ATP synthase subunit A [Alphaproteobacteria bacterium]|nr:F0F1 ATP synthase subunit A [Alphaproteobacteria bacterium]